MGSCNHLVGQLVTAAVDIEHAPAYKKLACKLLYISLIELQAEKDPVLGLFRAALIKKKKLASKTRSIRIIYRTITTRILILTKSSRGTTFTKNRSRATLIINRTRLAINHTSSASDHIRIFRLFSRARTRVKPDFSGQ